ncbi:MAG: noncanonical pyrimidine nucleotidase, YjjG family [Ilumatobacter sp.]|nr:noncanonical pyrimidine nucleotidase, YjjG family [Ilumatobacter sp.]
MSYATVLFDLDHTLFDSDESERLAYQFTMRSVGLDDPAAHFDRYVSINREMWAAVEAGAMRTDEVRHRRFERFVSELSLDADPDAMAHQFVDGLARHGELYPGARSVLESLTEHVSLALVTNGLSEVQRTRIERLDLERFFDAVVISSEVGVSKPRPQIFDLTFDLLGRPDPAAALMVGDSLSSDMRGARDYGIDACWFNPHGGTPDEPVTHQIDHLEALITIVRQMA